MQFPIDEQSVVAFDLDDTLYKEIDFVRSGFTAVLQSLGLNSDEALELLINWHTERLPVLDRLLTSLTTDSSLCGATAQLPLPSLKELLSVYRQHTPDIQPAAGCRALLAAIRSHEGAVAVVTDGRSTTQRNKIRSLQLDGIVEVIVVSEEFGSEKPDNRNFLEIARSFPGRTNFSYFADNPSKDFLGPNSLGWLTVQLDDDGRNIHSQQGSWPLAYRAARRISSLTEVVVVPR